MTEVKQGLDINVGYIGSHGTEIFMHIKILWSLTASYIARISDLLFPNCCHL